MASVVQICNMALSHLGSEARVQSISPPDGSTEAGYCSTFYDMARTELIEPGNWNFTLARRALALVDSPTGTSWTYAYALPSDCLRALRILPASAVSVFDTNAYDTTDRDTAVFDIEGGVLLTNEPDAVLIYSRDVTDTTKYSASFLSALAYLLAAYLAGPIVKGVEGVKVGDAMRERAFGMAALAATAAANASHSVSATFSSIESVRA